MLEITLTRSLIKASKKQKATAKALGLGKINSTVQQQDNAAIRGMIAILAHKIEVKEVK